MTNHRNARGGPTDIDRHVGNQIRCRRILRGVTQEKLAERSRLSNHQMQKYEAGKIRIPVGNLQLVAQALDCSASDLFPGAANAELDESRVRALGLMQDAVSLDERRLRALCSIVQAMAALEGAGA